MVVVGSPLELIIHLYALTLILYPRPLIEVQLDKDRMWKRGHANLFL